MRWQETDRNLRLWLDEFMEGLEREIRAARFSEERGGF